MPAGRQLVLDFELFVDSMRSHVEPFDDLKPVTDPPEDAVLPLRTNFSHTGKLAVAPHWLPDVVERIDGPPDVVAGAAHAG